MTFIAVFTALMTAFVLTAPIAMVALLVKGSVPMTDTTPAVASSSGRVCDTPACSCARDLALSPAG